MNIDLSTDTIAKAIYTINRHAKTAPKPKHLYTIKKKVIEQLLRENRAKKIGLHFSEHPKLSNQHSTLLVKVGNYYFHILPEKKDFENLEHLGELDQSFRNPQAKMSLSHAKKIAYRYLNWDTKQKTIKQHPSKNSSAYFIPTSLGKMDWPPTNTHQKF